MIPDEVQIGFEKKKNSLLGLGLSSNSTDLYMRGYLSIPKYLKPQLDIVTVPNIPRQYQIVAQSRDAIFLAHSEYLFAIQNKSASPLLTNLNIKKGVIEQPLFWIKDGRSFYFTYEDSDLIKSDELCREVKKSKIEYNDLQEGHEYLTSMIDVKRYFNHEFYCGYMYLGKFYKTNNDQCLLWYKLWYGQDHIASTYRFNVSSIDTKIFWKTDRMLQPIDKKVLEDVIKQLNLRR